MKKKKYLKNSKQTVKKSNQIRFVKPSDIRLVDFYFSQWRP